MRKHKFWVLAKVQVYFSHQHNRQGLLQTYEWKSMNVRSVVDWLTEPSTINWYHKNCYLITQHYFISNLDRNLASIPCKMCFQKFTGLGARSVPTLAEPWNIGSRGGTQIWVGQGCAARASKPIPIFKGDFGQKGYPFLRIFFQKYAYFSKIPRFSMRKPRKSRNLGLSQKSWPMFKDFLGKKRDPGLRISCKKATH